MAVRRLGCQGPAGDQGCADAGAGVVLRSFPRPADILIDAKTMLAALDKPGIALLDVRDVDEWIGESSSPYGKDFCPRKGRIPGAVWLEWYRMMKPTAEGPRFKSKDEILAECATVGISREYPGLSLLLQGRAGVEHLPRAQECRREGCPDVFRLLERMVARSVAADRRRPADGGQGDRQSGIKPACFPLPGRNAGQ